MKNSVLLTVTSLLSTILLSVHVVDDIVRGYDTASLWNLIGVAILVVMLCGTLILRERLSGIIIILLGSIFALGMPIIHLRGASSGEVAHSSGGFFFIWTLWALGVTGLFGIILCIRAIIELRRR